ncbi:response regulator [Paraburkholderia strydomiana]|uniref:response regulator n=1 Tax=Paraburkholderia strydomiana TaxID=1245417 RepID=UPI00203664E7|nr:response regulator [Paraburkholderia strydomiana]
MHYADIQSFMSFSHAARWTPRKLPEGTSDRRRVLVVDDYHEGAEAISIFLSLSGYETRFVLSGLQVADAITAWTPEIALLDINMPGMDGFGVARQLRNNPQTQAILVIAFTAQDLSGVWRRGIAAGFDGYFQKGECPMSCCVS